MGTEEMEELSSIEKKRKKPGQIIFTLKVAATDLPLDDKNFKMKLKMDFGPEFTTDLRSQNTGPNFHAKRVRSLLKFVSEDVIQKIVEFIYFKNIYIIDGEPTKLKNNDEINKIYAERSEYRAKGYPLENKPELIEEEKTISEVVNALINEEGREIEIEEKNVATVRFEELSPGDLWLNAQTIVNGDMPPPRLRSK